MMLRSGQKYAPLAVQKPMPFRTNLRYEELMSKAIKLDKKLGHHNDKLYHCIQQGKLKENTGAWSPVSLSPLSTPPSTPPSSPQFCPVEDDSEYSDISDVDSIPDLEDDGDDSDDSSDDPSHSHPPAAQLAGVTDAGAGIVGLSAAAKRRKRRKQKRARKEQCKANAKRRCCTRHREKRAEAAARKRDWMGLPKAHGRNFACRPIPSSLTIDDVDAAVEYKVTKGAYTVRRLDSLQDIPWEREELDELGFRHFAWCGQVAYVILDNKDRIIAVLVPPPAEGDNRSPEEYWAAAMDRVAELFKNERIAAEGSFSEKQTSHRRGDFTALATGVSYGGGQKKPGNLRQARKSHSTLLSTLTSDKDVQRIANFQSDVLASYFPKVYAHVYDSMATLSQSQPELCRNFQGSIYPTTTFNLGPATTCNDHNDCNNAPDVPCAITALGDFNPDKGGELIFFDLALIVRFPPGTTILLSSASIRHGNLPTERGEHRYSMTQYCLGGLLHWVRHGLCPASSLTKSERAAIDGSHIKRWTTVLGRLSKYDELERDRKWLLRWERGKA